MITMDGDDREPVSISRRRVIALMLEMHFEKAKKKHDRLVTITIGALLLSSVCCWLVVYLM
jgi:hypothetical protein